MRKPQFGLAIALLVVFFALALVRQGFERLIPPLPANKLANRPGGFLRNAVHQPVDWQPEYAPAAILARKLKKPCLVVLGLSSSKLANLMDLRVFSNWAVAARINTSFVPIRIDLSDQPRWRNAIFPVWRMKVPFVDGFQIVILDAQGRFRKVLPPPQELSQIDPTQFLDELLTTIAEMESLSPTAGASPDGVHQQEDSVELTSADPAANPQFDRYAATLNDSAIGHSGAFSEAGSLRLLPDGWRYLALVGRRQEAAQTLSAFITSPATDIVRGGFYDLDESVEDLEVNFSQGSVVNAQMASVLAEIGVSGHSDIFSEFGKQTFDMLIRDFLSEDGFAANRESDADPTTNRSPTTSYPSARLADLLEPAERNWAEDHLNLNRFQTKNPQLIPFLDREGSMADPMYSRIIKKLRSRLRSHVALNGEQYLNVNGNIIASLSRCGRIWSDAERLGDLELAANKLDRFVLAGGVCHTLAPAELSGYLGDYLAYSDAELQLYLSTGNEVRFGKGLEVLGKAITLFYRPGSSQFFTGLAGDDDMMPLLFDLPDISDDYGESTTACAIRLCHAYGRMLGPTAQGQRLVRIANETVARNSNLSVMQSPRLAAYYCAAADVIDPECAFVVGVQSSADAGRLYQMRPTRLVAAVRGRVRTDLANRTPGVYLVSGSNIAGPYSVEEATDKLPLSLQVGVAPSP